MIQNGYMGSWVGDPEQLYGVIQYLWDHPKRLLGTSQFFLNSVILFGL